MSGYARMWAKRQQVGDSTAKTLLKVYADWAAEDYSTWVTNDELVTDTEMDIKTIRKARDRLVALGFLIETSQRRGETRSVVVYQMLAPEGSIAVQAVDQRSGETLSLSPPTLADYEAKGVQKRSPSKNGSSSKGVQKRSPSKNGAPPDLDRSPSTSGSKPLQKRPQGVPNLEGNKAEKAELSREQQLAREAGAVGNSAAAAADEKDSPPENREREITDLLIGLERDRGKTLTIDRSKDRTVVLTWIGKAITAEQLREAHRLAVAARVRDESDQPTYVGFIARFVDEACKPVSSTAAQVASDWWLAGEEGLIEAGKQFGARPKHRDEPLPLYRAVVARAAGKGPWIDVILRDAQRTGGQFLQLVVATIGEKLMPVDWYAS